MRLTRQLLTYNTKTRHAQRLALRAICAALALILACCTCAPTAWGDVRRSDLIVGQTVEERGINSSVCPSIDAEYAFVVDEDGVVYFERDADTATSIASITKIMTAIVCLEIADEYDLLDSQITVSARAADIGESSAELLEGDLITVNDALKALMIPSGNDAAIALAEALGVYLCEGQVDDDAAFNAFVIEMNNQAKLLGCTDTYFENPHGLDSGIYEGTQHSTASDVAKIVLCAMENELFRDIVKTTETTITVIRNDIPVEITIKSTDELIGVYDGACGIKTGYTQLAGSCFAGACNRNDKYLYAIVLDSTSDAQRFADTQTLYDWTYDNTISYPLAHSSTTTIMNLNGQVREVPVVAEVAHPEWIDTTIKATLADPDAALEVFSLKGNISQSYEFADISGSIKQGDVIGRVTFYQANEVVAVQDLISTEDVDAPNFFESIGIWWTRLINNITGEGQLQAESVVLNETPLIYDKKL